MEIFETIGQSVEIHPNEIQTNISSLDSFSDVTAGETLTKLFRKEFKYTLDGLSWTEWAPLNGAAIIAIPIVVADIFDINYRYTRIGSDDTGTIEWHSLNLEVTKVPSAVDVSVFDSSIFSEFFEADDSAVLGWCTNVLRKLYEPGIIPEYLIRRNEAYSDTDYISLWKSVTCFFSYIVVYARQFETFDQNDSLLEEYLIQKGLYVKQDATLMELQTMMTDMLGFFRKRGSFSDMTELQNLLGYNDTCDEFLISHGNTSGWYLNGTSPINTYVPSSNMVNKIPDPFALAGAVTTVIDTFNTLDIGTSTVTGDQYNISTTQAYEVKFKAKGTGALNLQLLGYDASGAATTTPILLDAIPATQGLAFTAMVLPNATDWFEISVFIFDETQGIANDDAVDKTPNLGGFNARWNALTCKVSFELSATATFYVRDLELKPLSTDYNRVMLSGQQITEMWVVNNSGKTDDYIRDKVILELTPYNTQTLISFV